MRNLKISFCAVVILLAIFQFSENTVDPDLWGHLVFGQRILRDGAIPKQDIYSWTANGQPWINHEWLAEIVLAKTYALGGGTGILLLKIIIGLIAFGICLRFGARNLSWPAQFLAWGFAAAAVVEISFGFAARPQIFTALFLALELAALKQIHSGKLLWTLALPFLFLIWINTHGGALIGFGFLGLAATATTFQLVCEKRRNAKISETLDSKPKSKMILCLWLSAIVAVAALFCNPWKTDLLRWLVGSIFWLRPQIQEWNATPLDWNHATFFVLLSLAVFSWIFTQRPRAWWELAGCGAFAILALRAERNTPLFSLIALATVPPHLASALEKFRKYFSNLETLAYRPFFQKAATIFSAIAVIGVGIATFTLHKEHPLTMEVPRSQYPVGAIAFLQKYQLHGRMLVFFDWGEMVIFSLPDCPPSIDGRLDTCYSRELIAAHWKFYNSEPFDEKILNVDAADLALLPANLAGTAALAQRPGWKIIYYDNLAAVLARNVEHFPTLLPLQLPVAGEKSVTQGREPFPDSRR